MPEVDFDSLPIYLDPCTLLVLQLNRTMKEYLSDQEWTSSFRHEFAQKQAQSLVEQKHQIPHREFAPFNLFVMVLLHLFFVEG